MASRTINTSTSAKFRRRKTDSTDNDPQVEAVSSSTGIPSYQTNTTSSRASEVFADETTKSNCSGYDISIAPFVAMRQFWATCIAYDYINEGQALVDHLGKHACTFVRFQGQSFTDGPELTLFA